jgi:hypothetical protein
VNIISGPGEGEVIDEPQVTFAWEGNELVDSYRYRFDANDWSAWLEETSKTFDYLDEGNHSISVQSQYLTGDTSQVENISFMVDAVTGPALMFYPRRQEATVGESVMFQILAEEVTNLTATEFSINFDPAHLAITSVTQGEIFAASEESIFLTQYDNSAGTLSVITAILGGDEPSVAGTGVLIEIQMNVISASSSELTFSGSEVFRDPENNDLTINETVHGMIQSL